MGIGGLEHQIYTNVKKSHLIELELRTSNRVNCSVELLGGLGLLRARLDDFGDPINDVNNSGTLPSSPAFPSIWARHGGPARPGAADLRKKTPLSSARMKTWQKKRSVGRSWSTSKRATTMARLP